MVSFRVSEDLLLVPSIPLMAGHKARRPPLRAAPHQTENACLIGPTTVALPVYKSSVLKPIVPAAAPSSSGYVGFSDCCWVDGQNFRRFY